MWYDGEVGIFTSLDLYGVANPTTDFDDWGHFSQVVWVATETIGCATTLCPAGTIFDGLQAWFTICNYGPAGKSSSSLSFNSMLTLTGNVENEYGTNILEPIGEATVSVPI